MALTIRDVFGLLYPDADRLAKTREGAPGSSELDFPMWFPDPRKKRPRPIPRNTVISGQRALKDKINACRDRWERALGERYAAGYASSGIRDHLERAPPRFPRNVHPIWHVPPSRPYDLFLIAAYLLDSSGAYHHIQPARESDKTDCTRGEHDIAPDHVRHVAITKEDRDLIHPAAAAWRAIPWKHHQWYAMDDLADHLTRPDVWRALEPLFESWFVVFGAYADRPVFGRRPAERDIAYPAPCWWFHAWRLLAIADEAAKGTGFRFDWDLLTQTEVEDDRMPWFERLMWLNAIGEYEPGRSPRDFAELLRPESFAYGRREIGCVLPKVRTPSIGCTLRSLSHHLALLPANGVARGKWSPAVATKPRQPVREDRPSDQMNLLLVPFPYSIDPKSFCGRVFEKPDKGKPAFGYFDVHQDWLTEDEARSEQVVELVNELVTEAKKQSNLIHGMVFPELSLNLETYTKVRNHLLKVAPEVELFVAGISDNQKGRTGNFVAVSSFRDSSGAPGAPERQLLQMSVRDKHHRWKLDAEQLKAYGLMGVLSPEVAWWENIDLLSRRVDFTVIRPDLVVSALICEDLARVDPCQLLLRSIAPHLVIALLMDAPQVTTRWPARYATVLAEDPGCAVLTLTSRGLMTRQHRAGIFRSDGLDRYIAMWRDDAASPTRTIHCPYDAQAILLSIVRRNATDISLDGRIDGSAGAWKYFGHVPVRIHNARQRFDRILGEDDLHCWRQELGA